MTSIKFAEEIIKEIEKRGSVKIPDNYVTGEEFEKWLYEEDMTLNKVLNMFYIEGD